MASLLATLSVTMADSERPKDERRVATQEESLNLRQPTIPQSIANSKVVKSLLVPSVTDPDFETLLSKISPKVDREIRDPSLCIRGNLIKMLVKPHRKTFKGIVACRRYTALKDKDMHIVSVMKWAAETIAFALGRSAVEPNSEDFVLKTMFEEYQELVNKDVSLVSDTQFRDDSGDTYRAIDDNLDEAEMIENLLELGLPEWLWTSFIYMSYGDGGLGDGQIKGFTGFKRLGDDIQVLVHTFDGDDEEHAVHEVWVVCDSSLKEYTRVTRVSMHHSDSEAGHALMADLRDPTCVKMWDSNYTGLQTLAAAKARAEGCVDELKGGWCQTWSLFYLEESLLKRGSDELFLSNRLKHMFGAWHETPVEERTPKLISDVERFKRLFGNGEESPWCALTNFVRKLATRYMNLQDSFATFALERKAAIKRAKGEYRSPREGSGI